MLRCVAKERRDMINYLLRGTVSKTTRILTHEHRGKLQSCDSRISSLRFGFI